MASGGFAIMIGLFWVTYGLCRIASAIEKLAARPKE